jgi:hypothetical protein
MLSTMSSIHNMSSIFIEFELQGLKENNGKEQKTKKYNLGS